MPNIIIILQKMLGTLILITFINITEVKPPREFDGDVLFLIDSSTDVSDVDYKKQNKFAVELVKHLDIAPGKTRVGVLVYSVSPSLQIALGAQTSMDRFEQEMEDLPKLSGERRVDRALASAFLTLSSGRLSVPRIAVLLMAGNSATGSESLSKSVKKLLRAGVEIYVVPIGTKVNLRKLRPLVAKPNDVFPVKSFEKGRQIHLKRDYA